MTSLSPLAFVENEDTQAIALSLNNSLTVDGVRVAKVTLKESCLQILLEGEQIPAQEKCVDIIHHRIVESGKTIIKTVKVYGKLLGEDFPEWNSEFEVKIPEYPNLTALASQGDVNVITRLLERELDSDSLTIKVNLKNNCLQIKLASEQVPHLETVVPKIFNAIKKLAIPSVQKIRIYGYEENEEFPAWNQELTVEKTNNGSTTENGINQSSIQALTQPQSSCLKLAKQGDPQAITVALNYLLNPQNILAKITLSNESLIIIIQGEKTLDQEHYKTYLCKFVKSLELTNVKKLQIQAWQKGAIFQSWSQQIDLESQNQSVSWWDAVTQTVAWTGETVGGAIVQAGEIVTSTAIGTGSAIGSAALSVTDGVGYLFDVASNSPHLREITKIFQLDWLIHVIEKVDVVKAETEVKKLLQKYPHEKPHEIAHRIIIDKATYAGGLGLASSLLPGVAAAMFAVDLMATMLLQAEMVYQIAYAYGLDLKDPARQGEVLAIFGLSLGGNQALKVGSQYALKAGLGFLRNVPVAGAVIGASTNALMLYALGYGACRFYEAKINPLTMEATLEMAQVEGEKFIKEAISQQIIMDQILVHIIVAGNTGKTWKSILPELQSFNLSPASLETITQNAKFPPSLESLLAQLNQDFAITLLAQCEKVAQLDGVITPEEARIIETIANQFNLALYSRH